LQAISDGKVKYQELKQAIEQLPGAEDKRQLNILKHPAGGRYFSQTTRNQTEPGAAA
jgi:hypothetical protein